MKAKGIDVADFGPGEPDFPTPDHIKKAAIRAIHEDKSKYTPAGGTSGFVETHPQDGFTLRASAIDKAITPKTKLLIVNSPCNPTGGVVPPDEYERIHALCKKHNVWLMGDECYSHFVYAPNKPYSIASAHGA